MSQRCVIAWFLHVLMRVQDIERCHAATSIRDRPHGEVAGVRRGGIKVLHCNVEKTTVHRLHGRLELCPSELGFCVSSSHLHLPDHAPNESPQSIRHFIRFLLNHLTCSALRVSQVTHQMTGIHHPLIPGILRSPHHLCSYLLPTVPPQICCHEEAHRSLQFAELFPTFADPRWCRKDGGFTPWWCGQLNTSLRLRDERVRLPKGDSIGMPICVHGRGANGVPCRVDRGKGLAALECVEDEGPLFGIVNARARIYEWHGLARMLSENRLRRKRLYDGVNEEQSVEEIRSGMRCVYPVSHVREVSTKGACEMDIQRVAPERMADADDLPARLRSLFPSDRFSSALLEIRHDVLDEIDDISPTVSPGVHWSDAPCVQIE